MKFVFTVLFFLFPFFSHAQVWETAPEDLVSVTFPEEGIKPDETGSFVFPLTLKVKEGWHINAHKPLEEGFIPTEVEVTDASFLASFEVTYPEGKKETFSFSSNPLLVYTGSVPLTLKGRFQGDAFPLRLPLKIKFQGCNNTLCLPPMELSLSIPVKGGMAEESSSVGAWLTEKGWFLTLLLLFLSGLALNLTPCVYPMIPITIGFFGGQTGGGKTRTGVLALLYFFGITVTYSLLGLIASLSGSFFGQALQNPWVLVGVALVMVVLALSMFDLYKLQLPPSVASKIGGKGGYVGAFIMGALVGLVAAPCIGPIVLGLLTFVATLGNPVKGFILFFALSAGLGFPYLILGFFTQKLRALPRSGVWMATVERIFGFLLLIVAVYFLTPVVGETAARFLYAVLGFSFFLYIVLSQRYYKAMKGFSIFRISVGVLALAGSIWLVVPYLLHGAPAPKGIENALTPEALKRAQEEGKPVVIDFFADWCFPCKELEHKTFSDPRVQEALKSVIFLKADLTKTGSERVQSIMKKYHIQGVPTLVFLNKEGKEVSHLRSVGFIPPETFLEKLQALKE